MTRIAGKGPNYKHGMDGTPEYYAYYGMRTRCYNPKNIGYKHYGGRGIKVCDRWLESFDNFLEDMGKRPSPKHSLDRINSDGDYSPDNCRWADWKTQLNNRNSYNHKVTINGITKNVQQWCDEYNLSDTTFHNRLKRGWSGTELLKNTKEIKTHCKRGHEFIPDNIFYDAKGCRNCRQCKRDNEKRRYYINKQI